MPHKGTRSAVSVAGVGLMPPRSGDDSDEKTHDEKGGRGSLHRSSKPAGANADLEGVGSKPDELPDEFLPTQDELTFRAPTRAL